MIFLLLITPAIFVVAVWVVVSLFRVAHKADSGSRVSQNVVIPVAETSLREPMLVGAKAIRETGRQRNRVISLASPYEYEYGHSDGLPESWWEDVLRRRN